MRAGSAWPSPSLPGDLHVIRQTADRRKLGLRAPCIDPLERERIDGDRIFAREKGGVMHGVIGLRLRAAGILGGQSIHDIEDNFLADERIVVKIDNRRAAVAAELG